MLRGTSLREGDVRIPSGCAIAGIMDRSGARHDGSDILKSIALMHDRSNGLGGGFAAYGIYPEYKDLYAFSVGMRSCFSLIKYVSRYASVSVRASLLSYMMWNAYRSLYSG